MPFINARNHNCDRNAGDCPSNRESALFCARGAKAERSEDAVACEVRELAKDDVENLDLRWRQNAAEESGDDRSTTTRRKTIGRCRKDELAPYDDRKPITDEPSHVRRIIASS